MVTGANKGIGYGICKFLGKSGWQVIVGARNSERAEEAVKALKAEGVRRNRLAICQPLRQQVIGTNSERSEREIS